MRPVSWFQFVVLLMVVCQLLLQAPTASVEASETGPHIPGQVLVRVKPGQSAETVVRALNARQNSTPNGALILEVKPGQEMQAIAQLNQSEAVLFAEPVFIYSATGISGTVAITAPVPWHQAIMQVPESRVITDTSSINVAVLDTGCGPHPELPIAGGVDLYGMTSSYQDRNGHGTHVAGIIGAQGPHVYGMIPRGAQIYCVKVLGPNGTGTNATVAAGIDWATTHGMQVINMSLGGPDSLEITAAVQRAQAAGVLVIAACGNNSQYGCGSPANIPGVISVMCTNEDDVLCSFSTYGGLVSAPGDIYSTCIEGGWLTNDAYCSLSGTSQAAPQVAGLAALVWGLHPEWTAGQVKLQILNTADDLGVPGQDAYYGAGRINTARAFGLSSMGKPVIALTNLQPGRLPAEGGTVTITLRAESTTGGTITAVNTHITTAQTAWNVPLQPQAGKPGFYSGSFALPANTGLYEQNYAAVADATDSNGRSNSLHVRDIRVFPARDGGKLLFEGVHPTDNFQMDVSTAGIDTFGCPLQAGGDYSTGTIVVLRQIKCGQWGPQEYYSTFAGGLTSVRVLDLDGDGVQDLTATNLFRGMFIWKGGTGVHGFMFSETPIILKDVAAVTAQWADLNADQNPDLVWVNTDKLYYRFNLGDLRFSAITEVRLPNVYWDVQVVNTTYGPQAVLTGFNSGVLVARAYGFGDLVKLPIGDCDSDTSAVGDLNGDGLFDIAIPCTDAGNRALTFLQRTDGTFTPPATLSAGSGNYRYIGILPGPDKPRVLVSDVQNSRVLAFQEGQYVASYNLGYPPGQQHVVSLDGCTPSMSLGSIGQTAVAAFRVLEQVPWGKQQPACTQPVANPWRKVHVYLPLIPYNGP